MLRALSLDSSDNLTHPCNEEGEFSWCECTGSHISWCACAGSHISLLGFPENQVFKVNALEVMK